MHQAFPLSPLHRRTRCRFLSGQSLLEILVGLGVIALTLPSVAGLLYLSLTTVRVNREKSVAQSLIGDMSSAVHSIAANDWHALWSSTSGALYLSFDDGVTTADGHNDNRIALDEIGGANGTLLLGSTGNTAPGNAWLSGANCKAGLCMTLDGSDDVVALQNSSSTQITGDLTMAFWAYPANLAKGTQNPIGKTSSGEFNVAMNSSGALIYTHGGTYSCTVNNVFAQNAWVFVAITRNTSAQQVQVYKNGTLQTATCGAWAAPSLSSAPVRIGQTADGYWQGRIDEVRLYRGVVGVSAVQGLANSVDAFYPQNTNGIWQLVEGTEVRNVGGITFTRSFALNTAYRDGTGALASSGTDDPVSRKVSYTVSWGARSLTTEEYLSRAITTGAVVQNDWSGGSAALMTTFLAPTTFADASSSIVFANSGELSVERAPSGVSGVDSVYRYAWNDAAGWLDLYGVSYDSANALFSGLSASSSIGQISTKCGDISSCGTSNYGVFFASTTGGGYTAGEVYGYAWSPAVGWISFNCNQIMWGVNTCAGVTYKVTMNTGSGYLYGYAWNDIIGWISMNCNDPGFCGTPYMVKINVGSVSNAGNLTSQIFDSQVENGVLPTTVVWQGMAPGGTTVTFQVAAANSPHGPWSFTGPDGTVFSYYSGQPDTAIPLSSKYYANQRYLRYRIFLSATDTAAPTVSGIAITYAK